LLLQLTRRLHRGLARSAVRIVLKLADRAKALLGQTELQRVHESGSIGDANQQRHFKTLGIAALRASTPLYAHSYR